MAKQAFFVRAAEEGDEEKTVALMREFWGVDSDEDYLRESGREMCAKDSETSKTFLALENNEPVALARVITDGLGRTPYITDVYTRPAYRGRGMAGALMDSCEQWLKEKGYSEVCLHVGHENIKARHLYETKGYKTTFNILAGELGAAATSPAEGLTARIARLQDWKAYKQFQNPRHNAPVFSDEPPVSKKQFDYYAGRRHDGQDFVIFEKDGNPVAGAHLVSFRHGDGTKGVWVTALSVDRSRPGAAAILKDGKAGIFLEALSACFARAGRRLPCTANCDVVRMDYFRQPGMLYVGAHAMKKQIPS